MSGSYPYAPPANGRCDRAYAERIGDTEPPLKLDRHLKPSRRIGELQPPVVHYGWRLDDEFVQDYAEKHGLVHTQTINATDDNETVIVIDHEYDFEATYQAVIDRICQDLCVTYYKPLVAAVVGPGSYYCVSLFTNYNTPKMIHWKPIHQLKERFGETELPRWHMDATDCEWHY